MIKQERLSADASSLLLQAARFIQVVEPSARVADLVEKGLLRLRFENEPDRGYVITLDGADTIQGFGRYRLAVVDDPSCARHDG